MYASTSARRASASIRRAPSRTISSITDDAPDRAAPEPSQSAESETTVSIGSYLPDQRCRAGLAWNLSSVTREGTPHPKPIHRFQALQFRRFAADPWGILTASTERGHVALGTSDDFTGRNSARSGYVHSGSKRAELPTHQCFPNIAGCGTSTRGECRPAARRSIRRTPQQQVQSSHRLAYVSGTCRQRPTV